LAAHLEILPEVEAQFGPLLIPHLTMVALREQRDRLKPHQPSQLDVANELIDAERRGLIRSWTGELPKLSADEEREAGSWKDWMSLLERARLQDAFVLDLAIQGESELGRPVLLTGTERLRRLVTLTDVRQFLRASGTLEVKGSDEELAPAVERHRRRSITFTNDGVSSVLEIDVEPLRRGASLYMTHGGAEELARMRLVKPASELLQLFIDPADQDARRARLQQFPNVQTRIEWIEKLMRTVSDGLAASRYRLLPQYLGEKKKSKDDAGADSDDDDKSLSLSLRCLRDVVALSPDACDAVWIDDRYLNRHRFAGTTPIADVCEILGSLETGGKLTSERRWRLYSRMRAANVRILPLSPAEVVHHVISAPIVDDELVDTPALRVLRQSVAALLADSQYLNVPSQEEIAAGRIGELNVVRTHSSSVHAALVGLWQRMKGKSNTREAELQSDWVVDNLYIDLALLRAGTVAQRNPPEPRASALGVAGLLFSCLQLLATGATLRELDEDTTASKYANWVYYKFVDARMDADRSFREALLKTVRGFRGGLRNLDR